jgi:hypothetical protein
LVVNTHDYKFVRPVIFPPNRPHGDPMMAFGIDTPDDIPKFNAIKNAYIAQPPIGSGAASHELVLIAGKKCEKRCRLRLRANYHFFGGNRDPRR